MVQEEEIVTHPSHYTEGRKQEVIDAIRDAMTDEMFEGYLLGNVLKYLNRYRTKGGAVDLAKANVYLGWLCNVVQERDGVFIGSVPTEGSLLR